MNRIEIPFKSRFKNVMLNETKIMTSRNRRYGEPGDEFDAFGATFKMKDIKQEKLEKVALYFFFEEGCESPADFIDIWKKLHPKKGWDPEQLVWVHEFKKEAEQKKLEV
jgi:hypothetical protein